MLSQLAARGRGLSSCRDAVYWREIQYYIGWLGCAVGAPFVANAKYAHLVLIRMLQMRNNESSVFELPII